jgi:hypothetical protein
LSRVDSLMLRAWAGVFGSRSVVAYTSDSYPGSPGPGTLDPVPSCGRYWAAGSALRGSVGREHGVNDAIASGCPKSYDVMLDQAPVRDPAWGPTPNPGGSLSCAVSRVAPKHRRPARRDRFQGAGLVWSIDHDSPATPQKHILPLPRMRREALAARHPPGPPCAMHTERYRKAERDDTARCPGFEPVETSWGTGYRNCSGLAEDHRVAAKSRNDGGQMRLS